MPKPLIKRLPEYVILAFFGILFLALVLPPIQSGRTTDRPPPLTILVMDPLAEPLSCACVKGLGQRKYNELEAFLSKELDRRVHIVFEESLKLGTQRANGKVDLIIGQHSMVQFDAKAQKTPVRQLAKLTNPAGKTTVTGAFVVQAKSSIKNLSDLKGRKLFLGPVENAETHAAAVETLSQHKLDKQIDTKTASSIEAGVFAVSDGEADATLIRDYLLPLLEGCGKIAKGELRIIAHTPAVPFVEVFATDMVSESEAKAIQQVLLKVKTQPKLLSALESKTGFVLAEGNESQVASWPDWRGPNRDGLSPFVPKSFPKELKTLWTAKVTGPALAGVAAMGKFLVVPDKTQDLTRDVFRCFDAKTGKELWTLEYPAAAKLDYTNAPRATPVIHQDRVYLLGALGDLHCVELASGKIVWKKHYATDFNAARPNWGWSSPPLVVEEKLIINPGGKEASLAALDLKTGNTLWKTPGHAAAYSAFVLATVFGQKQIVGYDVAGLGGWDPQTGKRLWELIPPRRSDFNVGTPVVLENQLLVATENNETRLYQFEKTGKPNPKPVAVNHDLAPDTCSPVVSNGRVFCSAYGELFCLDQKQNLKTVWSELNDFFYEHTNIIAGNNRILVWSTSGDLLLISAEENAYRLLSHIRPFGKREVESMSHPAILKDRIFVRDSQELKCLTWNLTP